MVTFTLGRLRRRDLFHWLKTQLSFCALILMPEDVRVLFFRFFLLSDGLDSGCYTFRPIGTADAAIALHNCMQ